MNIRKATWDDLQDVLEIYDEIHDAEEKGLTQIGWIRDIYPTTETARDSLNRQDLFVLEDQGKIAGTAIINKIQVPCYIGANWEREVPDEKVCVIHTLIIRPSMAGRGYGKGFLKYYEDVAREEGCSDLRLDTNAKNQVARTMYVNLGYREVDVVPTVFNGIPGVNLVLLEKHLD